MKEKQENKRLILKIIDLRVSFPSARGPVKVLEGVNLSLFSGEILALVGETGSGKSVTARSVLNLVPELSRYYQGRVFFKGQDLLKLSPKKLSEIRGRKINMIFQNPQSSINPVFTIGEQICRLVKMFLPEEIKTVRKKKGISLKLAAQLIASEKLSEVGLTDTEHLLNTYAHEISGGMAQRVKIAMALLSSPDILIADEATSALDVTVQAHILKLLKDLCKQKQTSILFITHDLGIAAQICDRIAVMYAGRIVENAPTLQLFKNPLHPYTQGLLNSVPQMGKQKKMSHIPGIIPDLTHPPQGCRFHPRCEKVLEDCSKIRPEYKELENEHYIACHLYTDDARLNEGPSEKMETHG